MWRRNKRLENHHKVDLHGLHVNEAIGRVHLHARHLCALKCKLPLTGLQCVHVAEATFAPLLLYLAALNIPLRCAAEMTVEVITGKGLHSEKNVPKLMPAVIHYLNEVNLQFTVNPDGGSVIVYIPGVNGQPERTQQYSQDKDIHEHG